MKTLRQITNRSWAIALAATLMVGPALAQGQSGKKEKEEQGHSQRGKDKRNKEDKKDSNDQRQRYFEDRHHADVREYYVEQYRTGRCPPGLAKKNNGCMPPGHAKKWQIGQVLPRQVIYYEVPAPLVVRFGPPPSGHRYVRVDGDILLIAIATGLIIDALLN